MPELSSCRLSFAVALAASLLVACSTPGAEDEAAEVERSFAVAGEVAERGVVTDPVLVTGTIRPLRDVVVAAEGSGRVVDLAAALGDRVEKGSVLARLDSGVQQAQLDAARAGLRQSRALLALSEAGFARSETLIAGAATTTSQHFAAGIDLESAKAGVDSAQAQVALAERALADMIVRAPFTGTIGAQHIELGALVGPGTPAFALVDLTRVVVSVGIPAGEISRVQPGQAVAIQVPALALDVNDGAVTHIGPQPDRRTRTYPAEIEIDNSAGLLRSGMVARVEIIIAERSAVLVPEDAVVDDDPPHVFVIEDGLAKKHNVVLGRLVAGRYEARSGVKEGDFVATYGKQHLSDGVSVAPYDLPEATAAGEAAGSAVERLTP